MKRYKLTIEETRTYTHTVIIVTDVDIDDLCNNLEQELEVADDIWYSNYRDEMNIIDMSEDEAPVIDLEISSYSEVVKEEE